MSSDRSRIGLFCLASFSLLGFDLACTYITFAIKGMPLGYEMNPWFRLWMIRDGWALSFAKFFLLKAMLFALCGWSIFRTESRIFSFLAVQCLVGNHLIAICSHLALWWIPHWETRSTLLLGAGACSLLFTFFGIRHLRAQTDSPLPYPHQQAI
jgi:hypothetical protein